MITQIARGTFVKAVLLLLLVVAQPLARPAVAVAASSTPGVVAIVARPPLAAWYDKIWTKIERSLSTRTGVIQIGLLCMLAALWIIWWRPRR
jgi:hypothetical protein